MDTNIRQFQGQWQYQKISQLQIRALKFLAMSNSELREEINKAVRENPALEIVKNPSAKKSKTENYSESYGSAVDLQSVLEAREDTRESLQHHLMHQLNAIKVSDDEYELSQKLIYNLDKNGFYGSTLAPKSLLNKARPIQNEFLLQKCINRIQQMDPVGTCCVSPEESLLIQAKIAGDASEITLFLLDGHLEMLSPPEPEKVTKKIHQYIEEWNSKTFAKKLPFSIKDVTKESVFKSIEYILHLNPRPAADFSWENGLIDETKPNVVLQVTLEEGFLDSDDFLNGKIKATNSSYFQVKYASGELPLVQLSSFMDFDKETLEKARQFISNLQFRENTIMLQGCAIVSNQREFFLKGPGHIKPFTRRQLSQILGIHESTVSRMSGKKHSKYIQTSWGLFPASYFFSSGVSAVNKGKKVSSEAIKNIMLEILSQTDEKTISDNQLCKLLNEKGIEIARRTVSKYRSQLGVANSYSRK